MKDDVNLLKEMNENDASKRWELLKNFLCLTIRDILIMSEDKVLDNDRGFFDLGMDSFTAVQLKNKIREAFDNNIEIESTSIFDNPTVNELCHFIASELDMEIDSPPQEKEEGLRTTETKESEAMSEIDSMSEEELLKELQEETKQEGTDE